MMIVAHVDDFLVLGSKRQLMQLLEGLQGVYECSGQILGYDDEDVQELEFLGRTIRLADRGLEWECGSKHVPAFLDKLQSEFGSRNDQLESQSEGFKGVKTPGVKRTSEEEEDRIPLRPAAAKVYRG